MHTKQVSEGFLFFNEAITKAARTFEITHEEAMDLFTEWLSFAIVEAQNEIPNAKEVAFKLVEEKIQLYKMKGGYSYT